MLVSFASVVFKLIFPAGLSMTYAEAQLQLLQTFFMPRYVLMNCELQCSTFFMPRYVLMNRCNRSVLV